MDEKKYNDEIEILDGLDDVFSMPENIETTVEEPKEEQSFTFDDELFQPVEEEVLNVLEEPVVDMNKIEESKPVTDATPFTDFTPDSIEIKNEESSSLMKEPTINVNEEPQKNEIPSMDEIFYMDFDEFEKKEEANNNVINNTEINNIDLVNEEIKEEPVIEQPVVETSINEEPVVNEISIENNEQINNDLNSNANEVDLDKTNFYLDEVLKPVSLEENKQESSEVFTNNQNFDFNVDLEPVKTEDDSLDKTNFDINYNFADQVDVNNVDNSIDNAFTFENDDIPSNNTTDNVNNNDLGETVIIEPVDLKPVEKVEEEKKEEPKPEVPAKVEEEKKVEETKTVSTDSKNKEKKKDGRFFVLILLIVMLLLSFVILLPTIIEKFAI